MSISQEKIRPPVSYDRSTLVLIKDLHPELREDTFNFATECWNIGISLRIYSTKISSENQDFLYSFGRTRPGAIQTMHRGGYSLEEMGFAMKLCLFNPLNDAFVSWEYAEQHKRSKYYFQYLEVRKKLTSERGWTWRNNKPLPMADHFEKTFGYTHGELTILKHNTKEKYIQLDKSRVDAYESMFNRKSKLYQQTNS